MSFSGSRKGFSSSGLSRPFSVEFFDKNMDIKSTITNWTVNAVLDCFVLYQTGLFLGRSFLKTVLFLYFLKCKLVVDNFRLPTPGTRDETSGKQSFIPKILG